MNSMSSFVIPKWYIRVVAFAGAPYAAINDSAVTGDYYGTGIDVTPNGREAVYSYGTSGGIRQMYASTNRPLTLAVAPTYSSVTSVASLPGNAHKVRFNNFQQDP